MRIKLLELCRVENVLLACVKRGVAHCKVEANEKSESLTRSGEEELDTYRREASARIGNSISAVDEVWKTSIWPSSLFCWTFRAADSRETSSISEYGFNNEIKLGEMPLRADLMQPYANSPSVDKREGGISQTRLSHYDPGRQSIQKACRWPQNH